MSLELRFRGVRGSIPTPQRENLGYGGNTSCLEIRYKDRCRVILDAGTGIRGLGADLLEESYFPGSRLSIFLTHFHWDHIQGLPFFLPLFQSDWELTFLAGHAPSFIKQTLEGQLKDPYFGAEAAARSDRRYVQVGPGGWEVDGLSVKGFPLCHPGGSTGYRVEAPGVAVAYVTDHEHGDTAAARALPGHCREADVLIYDAPYTPEENEARKGWGHSTWLEATRLAREARVKQLVLFHHDPQHDDKAISRIVEDAAAEFDNTIAAREGLSIRL